MRTLPSRVARSAEGGGVLLDGGGPECEAETTALTVRSLTYVGAARYDGPMTHNWRVVSLQAFRLAAGSGNSRDAPGGLPRGLQHDCVTYQSILPEVPEASG